MLTITETTDIGVAIEISKSPSLVRRYLVDVREYHHANFLDSYPIYDEFQEYRPCWMPLAVAMVFGLTFDEVKGAANDPS